MIYVAASKRAIPQHVRRAVALRFGSPGRSVPAWCAYCGDEGHIDWMSASWVTFRRLELDHAVPESRGGQAVEDNIVLACRRCNRSKGWRRTPEEMAA